MSRDTTSAGHLIRRGRNHAGLSLRALAERAGVSHVYLGEIERSKTVPPPWRLIELSYLLGIDQEKVLTAARREVAERAARCALERWEAKQ